MISIHALLAESDVRQPRQGWLRPAFLSTLSLRRATGCIIVNIIDIIFLSTLSLRRATLYQQVERNHAVISIHALLAESDFKTFLTFTHNRAFLSTLSLRRATRCPAPPTSAPVISIHALLAESDEDQNCASSSGPLFLSTLSLRRATHEALHGCWLLPFLSTLSLRRATYGHASHVPFFQISIHALLAESDWVHRWIKCRHLPFLSTLSLRRATRFVFA